MYVSFMKYHPASQKKTLDYDHFSRVVRHINGHIEYFGSVCYFVVYI